MQRLSQLLLILGIGQAICAAAAFEFPDLTRRIPERSMTPGCAYKGERFSHGDQVETLEPCLNCTCIRAVVVCYLRVCPSAPAPPPGCFLAREVGQCCPTLVCGGSGGSDKKPDSEQPTYAPELRPTFQPVPDGTTTVDEENSLVFVSSTVPDDDIPFLNDIPGGCLVNGTLYGDGSAMLSSSFCEYCFCIRGKTTCLKPKCDLYIEGCTPLYDSHFSCCPSRYECYQKTPLTETSVTTEAIPVTFSSTTTDTGIYDDYTDCIVDKHLYHQGDVIGNYRSCHSCYCSNSSIICDKIKCSPPLAGCHPIIPEGHCCPVSYKCDYHEDTGNYNTKGVNSNGSNSEPETKKTDIKTVKQSELFKNNPSPTVEERTKIQPISKDLSTFFNNFVPIHRRLDEDIAELYLSSDEKLNLRGEVLSENSTNLPNFPVKNSTPHSRENDKTLNLDFQGQTTSFYSLPEFDMENSRNHSILPSQSTKNEEDILHTVSVGSPEEKLFTIRQLLDEFFINNHANSSKTATKGSFETKRNNSKHSSSIGDALESNTPQSFYSTQEMGTSYITNKPLDITENQVHSTKLTPQENDTEYTSTVASNIITLSITDKKLNPLLVHTTLHFEEDEDLSPSQYGSTPYIIRGTKNNRTYSTPSQVTETSVKYVTEKTTNFDFSSRKTTPYSTPTANHKTYSIPSPVTDTSVGYDVEKSTNLDISRTSTTKSEPSATHDSTTYIVNTKNHDKTYFTPPPITDTSVGYVTDTSTNLDIFSRTSTTKREPTTSQNSTPYITKVTKYSETSSISPPITDTSLGYITEKYTNLDFALSTSATNDEPDTTQIMKASSRINSKLPLSSHGDTTKESPFNSYPLLDESLINLYLPAEGRDSDIDDDFTNVGAIHLGAPLSVAATESRRDPSNLRNKITVSGGVIFMDPKYTDIHPDVPSTKNQPKPTETNPIRDTFSEFTDYPTPIERSDIDYANHDLKKGPRIQDVYNLTNVGQDFKIIPFVAEDAIRGINGKGNNTFQILQGSTQGPPDMVSDFCFIKGRIYKNGEMISKSDPCELCRCFYGQELCQLQRCPTPPPGCTPEKLPAFCCPRYTCGNNSSFKEHSPQDQTAIDTPSNSQFLRPTQKHDLFEKTRLSGQRPEAAKFGTRVRPIPISKPLQTTPKAEATQNLQNFDTTTRKVEFTRTSETQPIESTRDTKSQITGITRSSTNRISTTKQPRTTKDSSSYFPDPWGLLKVSGCNIYGKFFKINDQVEILSGPCSHCICTANGVECNDIC